MSKTVCKNWLGNSIKNSLISTGLLSTGVILSSIDSLQGVASLAMMVSYLPILSLRPVYAKVVASIITGTLISAFVCSGIAQISIFDYILSILFGTTLMFIIPVGLVALYEKLFEPLQSVVWSRVMQKVVVYISAFICLNYFSLSHSILPWGVSYTIYFRWLIYKHASLLYLMLLGTLPFIVSDLLASFRIKTRFVIIIIVFGLIFVLTPSALTEDQSDGNYKIAIVQPNVSWQNKWSKDVNLHKRELNKRISVLNNLIKLASTGDMVVLPENYIPDLVFFIPDVWNSINEFSNRIHGVMCIGGLDTNIVLMPNGLQSQKRYYSGLFFIDHGKCIAKYYQRRLIPYIDESMVVPGSIKPPIIVKGVWFNTLLCQESTFLDLIPHNSHPTIISADTSVFTGIPGYILASLERMYSQLIAVVTGNQVIFCNNKGLSAVIDPHGHIVKTLPYNYRGILTIKIKIEKINQKISWVKEG